MSVADVESRTAGRDESRPLRIALVGYGKMGRAVESAARAAGWAVAATLDSRTNAGGTGITAERFAGVDVALDFSRGEAVLANLRRLAEVGVSVVIGTTGWQDDVEAARQVTAERQIGVVYGANFAIGVNLFYRLAERAAELFARFEAFDPFIFEEHHRFKRDAPSGTARELAALVERHYGRPVPISSVRAGHIPGTHVLGFDAEAETVRVEHVSRSRAAFAQGALLAARWIAGRHGFYSFAEVLDDVLAR